MIPYRRQKAIESGSMLVVGDLAVGDSVLVRRPGQIERSTETVTGIRPGKVTTVFFDGFSHESSSDMPVRVVSFTEGSWRQHVPTV